MKRLHVIVVLSFAIPVLAITSALVWANWHSDILPANAIADRLVVDKSERTLQVLHQGRVLGTYKVSFGAQPQGHKQREGDERTPEGQYVIDWRNPKSVCYRSLHISYPNAADKARARAQGVSPGGNVMIHGIQNGSEWVGKLHRLVNWTDGCVAVTNGEMRELWQAVPNGTPIEIRP